MSQPNHDGQRPLREVEAALDAEAILTGLPKGMPLLSVIKTELARMGYPESDAADVFDTWLESGFRTKAGPILDWKASLRKKARNGWLLSQKQARSLGHAPGFSPPAVEEMIRYALSRKWTTSYARWCHQYFIATGWTHFNRPVTSTEQWQALMSTELMDRAPR